MTKAAKEAQWGDHDSDASSAGTHRMEENFFEDVSDEETSDSEGEIDELADGTGGKQPKSNIYDQYFGEFRRPLTRPRSASIETSSTGSKGQAVSKANSGDNLVGPSSDMLSPEVIVARAFDIISLNNQSQQLACQLDLGRWTEVNEVIEEPSGLDESYQTTASPRPKKQVFDSVTGQNRFASPPRNNHPMQHATSDPLLGTRTPKRLRRQSERAGLPVGGNVSLYRYTGDERGVRGGEYGVRPNVQESMVFLRKLFTHQQQEGGGGGGGYAGLISPPDGPLLPSSLTPPGKRNTNPAVTSHRTAIAKPGPSLPQPGVYTICADGLASRTSARVKLVETRTTCLHNAAVCVKLGEQEKADVWELLSQVVDGRLIELEGANDCWRPRHGNALGTNLVSNTLRYYESLGDVQMLSTIVCVLRSKLPDSNRSKIRHSDYSLLPAGDESKYDTYLRIYADLLYGWGLLAIRAELNKHLVRVIHSRESAAQMTVQKSMDEGRIPGIALVFTCPTCGEDTDIGTNYCRSCRDFAFRCIICDQAVRGLLSVCDRENCRHGGHPSCLKEWFSLHKECPSGCGCNCTLLTPVILSAPEPGQVINEFI
jgi:Zinc-ribbon, C4HC2 type